MLAMLVMPVMLASTDNTGDAGDAGDAGYTVWWFYCSPKQTEQIEFWDKHVGIILPN